MARGVGLATAPARLAGRGLGALLLVGLVFCLLAPARAMPGWGASDSGAGPLPRPLAEVVVYRNLTCFNYRVTGPRHCARWRVSVRRDGSLAWSIRVTNIALIKDTFEDTLVFMPALRRQWMQILEKGRRWSRIARSHQVDLEKPLGRIGQTTSAVFVSSNRGGYCAVRFANQGWTDKGPVYMYVPYEQDRYSPVSMATFLRNLARAGVRLEGEEKKYRQEQELFK